MRLEIDIAEHHYNNIMALDSVSLGRVPYKGIIMYSINAIKHGKVLEQELTTENEAKYCDRNICLKNEYNNIGCEDCEVTKSQDSTTKNDSGVDCISRADVHDMLENLPITVEDKWFNWLQKACMRLAELPSVTPQPCEDAISRQAVLDLINADWKYEGLEIEINNLPSVTPQESRWIPVSEKLPKEFETVILSTDKDEVFVGDYLGKMNDGSDCFDDNDGMMWEGNVVAWMPFPKSYRKVEK